MVRHRKPPSQTWRTFLENHVKNLVSVDLEDLRLELQSTCFQSTIPKSKTHFISYLRRMPQDASVPRHGINANASMLGSRPIPNSGPTISRLGHGLHHAAFQG